MFLYPGAGRFAGPIGEQDGPDPCSHEPYIPGIVGSGGFKPG